MNQSVAVVEKPTKIAVIDREIEARKDALLAVMPDNLSYDRFRRVVTLAIAKNPDLLECTASSIITAVIEAAQLGLEPTGSLSRAWLIAYNKNVGTKQNPKWAKEAQLQIGYMGLVELALRSGRIRSAEARLVYEGDIFEVEFGTDQRIVHKPMFLTSSPEKITLVYAVVWRMDSTWDIEVMRKDEIDGIRARSKSANHGPWVSDYGEMARKTVLRRLLKRQPLTVETIDAIAKDDEIEYAQEAAYVAPNAAKARIMAKLRAPDPGEVMASEPTVDEAAGEVPPEPVAPTVRRRKAPGPSPEEEARMLEDGEIDDAEMQVGDEAGAELVAAVVESAPAQKDDARCGNPSPWDDGVSCELDKGHSLAHRANNGSWPTSRRGS